MDYNLVSYDEISIEMLELLTEFSSHINRISILNDCLLTNDLFNSNPYFIQYIYYFDTGRYYHFRCMGYMEALVLTKCYSEDSLCYWKDMLVMPAYNNIMMGVGYLEKLEHNYEVSCNEIFRTLMYEIEGLKGVAMEIMDLMMSYNLLC